MNRVGIILGLIVAWGILAIPIGAVAHPSHADLHAQSPFDAPKAEKNLHCQLKGHLHAAQLICPHTQRVRPLQTEFKADCGDSPNGTLVQIQWPKTVFLCPSVGSVSASIEKRSLTSIRVLLPAPHFDPLEKPPRPA